jgi:hypothetical protein
MSDVSALSHLARDLGAVADGVAENLLPAMRGTAGLVKNAWNEKLYNEGHASRTRGSISYDVGVAHDFDLLALDIDAVRSSTLVAEIGPRTSRTQSGIVKLLELGSINNPPHGYGAAALDEHEGDYETAIAFAEAAAAGRWGL